MSFNIEDHPHKRFNPLTGGWVLVSPHRAKRPWQGQVERANPEERPSYDPKCYLCRGNERAGGKTNPDYKVTYVFTNDFNALLTDSPAGEIADGELFQAKSECGICRVICFNEDHSLTIPEDEKIYGRLRNAGNSIAQYYSRTSCGATGEPLEKSLQKIINII